MLTLSMDKAYESGCAKYHRSLCDDGFTWTVTSAADANKVTRKKNPASLLLILIINKFLILIIKQVIN